MKYKSGKTLYSLIEFCYKHPELRFWQALYAWMNCGSIRIDDKDPFHWKGKVR